MIFRAVEIALWEEGSALSLYGCRVLCKLMLFKTISTTLVLFTSVILPSTNLTANASITSENAAVAIREIPSINSSFVKDAMKTNLMF
jgi:hypothetical protein